MSARTASSVAMIATVSSIGSRSLSVLPAAMYSLRRERLVLHAASLDLATCTPRARCRRRRRGGTWSGVYQTRVDVDPGVGADDVGDVGSGGVGCRDRRRDRARRVREDRRDLAVGAGRAERRARRDGRRGAEHVPRERDRVDAEVEQRAAAELEGVEPVGGVGADPLGVVGEDGADLAERARRRAAPGCAPCAGGSASTSPPSRAARRSAATSRTRAASVALSVNGFSTRTCLPASSARIAFSACSGCGVEM